MAQDNGVLQIYHILPENIQVVDDIKADVGLEKSLIVNFSICFMGKFLSDLYKGADDSEKAKAQLADILQGSVP